MNLAKQGRMRRSISIKHLTLAAGIVVALIVAFLLASTGSNFSADSKSIAFPTLELPTLAKVVAQKIQIFF